MRILSVFFLFFLLLAVWGCGDERTSPVVADTSEPAMQEMPAEVEKIIDEYSFDNDKSRALAYMMPYDVISGDTYCEWDAYAVTFLWGQFCGIPTNVAVQTDWTGDLSVNGIAQVRPIHKIDFEEGQDWLVEVSEPAKAAWVSFTNGDFDGLCFIVLIKKGVEYFAPLYLTFNTEPFHLALPIEKLAMFKAFYLADNYNAVAVFAHKIWHNHCPSGLMEGKWIKEDIAGRKGLFEGLWLDNRQDEPAGYFSGQFWTEDDGTRLMEGYVSGYITDQVIAHLKGRWYYDDPSMCPICGSGHGIFQGKFEFMDREGWGYFGGTFGWPTTAEELALPLRGVWKMNCPTVSDANGWD